MQVSQVRNCFRILELHKELLELSENIRQVNVTQPFYCVHWVHCEDLQSNELKVPFWKLIFLITWALILIRTAAHGGGGCLSTILPMLLF